ncbi:hypothetical protein BGZ65_009049, partial [Modicella reniformis]
VNRFIFREASKKLISMASVSEAPHGNSMDSLNIKSNSSTPRSTRLYCNFSDSGILLIIDQKISPASYRDDGSFLHCCPLTLVYWGKTATAYNVLSVSTCDPVLVHTSYESYSRIVFESKHANKSECDVCNRPIELNFHIPNMVVKNCIATNVNLGSASLLSMNRHFDR